MTRVDFWDWMDILADLAFSSAEPLADRVAYARWWADLGEALELPFCGL